MESRERHRKKRSFKYVPFIGSMLFVTAPAELHAQDSGEKNAIFRQMEIDSERMEIQRAIDAIKKSTEAAREEARTATGESSEQLDGILELLEADKENKKPKDPSTATRDVYEQFRKENPLSSDSAAP